jgi:hypothetical protein
MRSHSSRYPNPPPCLRDRVYLTTSSSTFSQRQPHHMPRTRPTWQRNRPPTPGERLYKWLAERYSPKPDASTDWISQIASDFNARELESLIHQSTLLMMLRRLLANAEWYKRRYSAMGLDNYEEKFEQDYLRYHLSFAPREARQLSNLVYRALDASGQGIPRSIATRIKDRSEQRKQPCELCGKSINYASTSSTDPDRFSLDHIWPSSLGGSSDESNLRVACGGCNAFRQNYVNASDTHYEHLHAKLLESDESFPKEVNRIFRLAIHLQSNFSCKRCDRPASQFAEGLQLEPRSRNENHNIFNSISICADCKQ